MSFLVCAGETSGYSILPTTEYGSSASCQYNIFKDPKCSGLSTPLLAVGAESGSLSPGRADSALPERAPTPASTRPRKKVKMVRKAGIDPKIYGHIPDVPVLSTFLSRLECSGAGVHAPTRAGIHGSKKDGAYSIVMSGGYEDDEDRGETFIYTGEGGRGSKTSSGKNTWSGAQERDQEWTGGNLSLQLSQINGSPVRVVRGGSGFSSRYAPDKGRYRYDGLYTVTEATRAKGKTGFMTCQFTFKRLPGQPPLPGIELRPAKRRRNREADDELEPGPSKRQRHKSLRGDAAATLCEREHGGIRRCEYTREVLAIFVVSEPIQTGSDGAGNVLPSWLG
ncbi:PUA-like domain-containing protein [Mycena galopus ATCC 62051]|nr:PUA-like domain-containing protein [Mycena galopus ATCC 62051]